MTGTRASRTLPGFRFETKAPPLAQTLPRMDIAVFVGFAASGPLHTPVAVESEAQFETLFGRDAPLAWDVKRGEQVYAYLAPAVRAFFRNGGRRCWVIRVASSDRSTPGDLNRARYNYFPVPALMRATTQNDGTLALIPGFARARSEGSWSDLLSVGSALLSRPEALRGVELHHSAYIVHIVRPASDEFAVGDLIRLIFKNEGLVLFLTVDEIDPLLDPPSAIVTPSLSDKVMAIKCSKPLWFEIVSQSRFPPPESIAQVHTFTHQHSDVAATDDREEVDSFKNTYDAVFDAEANKEINFGVDESRQKITLDLQACPPADAPAPGSVIRVDIGGGQLWMTVEGLGFNTGAAVTSVSGPAVRWLESAPALPSEAHFCERLTFELWVRKGEEFSVSLSDLGFEPGHKRFWGSLPTDAALYQEEDHTPDPTATVLWRQLGDLFRFPLAGIAGANEVHFPLAMTPVPEKFLGPVRLPGSDLQRDGLAEFDARLFTDPDLVSVPLETLASQTEFLLYLSPQPRRLTGMHAAYALEEPTIIAVPDAVHRTWSPGIAGDLPVLPQFAPPLRPELKHFLDCLPKAPVPEQRFAKCDPAIEAEPDDQIDQLPPGSFRSCSISEVAAPQLFASEEFSASGTFTLLWMASPVTAANYVLEEATVTNFDDATIIYSGTLTSFTIYGRKAGDYFYRVKATIKADVSDWSNCVVVRVTSADHWLLKENDEYNPDTLLAVQRSLLRMCAARGDLFAVMTLPADYREDKAIAHVSLLKTSFKAPATQGVQPLSAGEVNAFSYGAIYHPWLINAEDQAAASLRRIPPCGAVSGVFAHRAVTRGAWVAPANEPILGTVAMEPLISRERFLDLQNANINLVRLEPRGFIVLNSDTLSDEEDLRQINVRRLLILLRRQALRLGTTYVFEPHSPAFRRMVERGFTSMLDEMFERGAFAGNTPRTAYRVVTDESLNTTQSMDQGRFLVELRVAPSLPLTFLTIRFVQTGDRSFVMEGR
jgi:hypothetical protein